MSHTDDVLKLLGFESVRSFQRAWNLGVALDVDGIVGRHTTAALKISETRHRDGRPDISLHFSAKQFQCHCRGELPGCQNTLIYRGLLAGLEDLTRVLGRTPGIVSGYRCPRHNASVGGASGSQHLYGTAADIEAPWTLAEVRRYQSFSGIGAKQGGAHRVTHVDRRDLVEAHNTTHSTRRNPAIWYYPGS
jgi:zinc D-Ala-D-Ala carboxypeptidase